MGYSRATFYRIKKAYEDGGVDALTEKTRSGLPQKPGA
jgi:transposase